MRRLSRPWLTQGLRFKQPPVPDCFSLLETVLAAVLLVVTTLSTYSLFQVNMNVSKFSHELDAADRELSGKMQEIRELGKTFKWCAKAPNPADGYVESADINSKCNVNAGSAGSQSYYAESAEISDFNTACKRDAGQFNFVTRKYDLAADTLLPVLVDKIRTLSDANAKITVDVSLLEKTTRRLLVELVKTELKGELAGSRKVTRYLYLVPEVAKWCPS